MDLLIYAKEEQGTGTASCPVLEQIAALSDCSVGTLYLIALGHKKPSALLAKRIEAATKGAVSCHDLRPDIFGPAPASNSQQEAA